MLDEPGTGGEEWSRKMTSWMKIASSNMLGLQHECIRLMDVPLVPVLMNGSENMVLIKKKALG